jgi:hypothetical protein
MRVRNRVENLRYATAQVLVDPINHVAIRREQAQRAAFFDSLQRAQPRIELLLRQLGLK